MNNESSPLRRFRRASIQRKQMLVIMLTSCVALLLACVGFVTMEVLTFRSSMVQSLSTMAGMIANNSTAALQFGLQKDADNDLAVLKTETNIDAAWILRKDGAIFAEYHREGRERAIIPKELGHNDHLFQRDALFLQRVVMFDREPVGYVCLQSNLEGLYLRLEQ